ncbi:hypothetical protein CATMIT_01632, partial [Catenibacterium mitsuokai DSM 15897]
GRRRRHVLHFAVLAQPRFDPITVQAVAGDGFHIAVQQAVVEQFADQERQPAGGVEVVHVGAAVGIHPRQQRHRRGQRVEILQAQLDAGGRGHRHQMQQVVGSNRR